MDRVVIAARWRERAEELEGYARRMRSVGDRVEAMGAEQAATEYRIAADELEAEAC